MANENTIIACACPPVGANQLGIKLAITRATALSISGLLRWSPYRWSAMVVFQIATVAT